jgi:chromosome segregation ATPase
VSEERIAELEQELEITLADMESLAVQLAETESCYSDTLAELVEREGELEDLNAQFDALEEEVRGVIQRLSDAV